MSDFSSIFDENVKSYQDAFSDIRNGVITLPTFLLIKEQSILNALDDAKLTKNIDWRKEVMQLITKNNILGKIKKLTNFHKVIKNLKSKKKNKKNLFLIIVFIT